MTQPTHDSKNGTDAQCKQKIIRKTPEQLCACLGQLADHDLVRFVESIGPGDRETKLVPALDNKRRGVHASTQIINYCPYCGKKTFDLVPVEQVPEAPQP